MKVGTSKKKGLGAAGRYPDLQSEKAFGRTGSNAVRVDLDGVSSRREATAIHPPCTRWKMQEPLVVDLAVTATV